MMAEGDVPLDDGGNRAALRDLMYSGRQRRRLGGTVEECVEAIRRGHNAYLPEDYVTPGAQEWCECVVADPPTIFPRREGQDLSRADWDRAFDRCRALVLDDSDINTVDICRGMFGLFTVDMRTSYHSFCGRLCARNDPLPLYSYVNSYSIYGLNLGETCNSTCARNAMPGYCSKYTLVYSDWVSLTFYSLYGESTRRT